MKTLGSKLAVGLLFVFASTTSWSATKLCDEHCGLGSGQDRNCKPMPSVLRFNGLRDQLRLWAQKEVVPTLREWKTSFDKQLSTADLTRLNELRASAAEYRQQHIALMQKMSEKRKEAADPDSYTNDPGWRSLVEELQALKDKERALLPEVKKIAERYETELKALGETARPKLRLWMASAMQQAQDAASQKDIPLSRIRPEMLMHALPGLSGIAQPGMQRRAVAHFLLWDGVDLLDPAENPMVNPAPAQNKISSTLNFELGQNSPNPVTGSSTTINFSIAQAGHVRIALYDASGAQVAVICDQTYPAGASVVEFPVSQLNSGSYTYRLECSQGTLSNTMTIVK